MIRIALKAFYIFVSFEELRFGKHGSGLTPFFKNERVFFKSILIIKPSFYRLYLLTQRFARKQLKLFLNSLSKS